MFLPTLNTAKGSLDPCASAAGKSRAWYNSMRSMNGLVGSGSTNSASKFAATRSPRVFALRSKSSRRFAAAASASEYIDIASSTSPMSSK